MLSPTDAHALKLLAARRALELVRAGMLIGLGTGTTARLFTDGIAEMVASGMAISAVASSKATEELARSLGIPLVESIVRPLDLAVDGADEVDARLNCIKGGGGALLREKVVAHAALRFIVIADESKLVSRLGRGAVPVEVLPFLWGRTASCIAELGGSAQLRLNGEAAFHTDNGNLILDCSFGEIEEPGDLGVRLHAIPGVIEHGLFVGMASAVIVAGAAGLTVLGDVGAG